MEIKYQNTISPPTLLKETEIKILERKRTKAWSLFKNYSDSASGLLILFCSNSRGLILFVKPCLSKRISFLLSLLYYFRGLILFVETHPVATVLYCFILLLGA